MFPRLKILVTVILTFATPAFGQSVQQSGNVTPGHIPWWITAGVIGDGGSAADSPITSIGVTGQICSNSARISTGAWVSLCMQANTGSPGTISIQNNGTAAAQNLNFVINGVTSTPAFVTGNPTPGDLLSFQSGQVVQDSGIAAANGIITGGIWHGSPVPVGFGGTGAASAAQAQVNLGLGTIATQNANAVAITGGTITGLPSPVNPTDAAIKSYVDSNATGLIILPQSALATTTVLPNTPTYSNGSSGVGATLTAGSNSTLTVDGTVATINTVVLVKNQASAFQNGIYTVTTAGSGSAAWVLTRATYFDVGTTQMKVGSYTFITGGSTNINTSWTLAATVVTVGTDPANFNQFSSTGGAVSSINGLTGALTLGTLTATATGANTARSVNNLYGDFITVKDFGAVGDGSTDDTAAFQAAIDASCPGHLSGLVNQIFALNIPSSANPYRVSQLNATNCAGFTLWGWGSGAVQPVLKYINAQNAILDLTGSVAGLNLRNFQILGPTADGASGTYPVMGMLIATTSAGGGNFDEIDNVNVSGRWQTAGVYIYGVCCSLANMVSWNNYNQNNANSYGVVFTTSNVSSVTSAFATIGTGTKGMSDWTCNRCEFHAFTGGSTTSGQPLFLDGATGFQFTGGQIGSANSYVVRTNGNVALSRFSGTTFYTDQGPAAVDLFGSATPGSGTIQNIILENISITLGVGGSLFGGPYSLASGTAINSTLNVNGTVTQFHSGGIGTAPVASSCGSTPNPVGTDQDGVVTVPGSTSGCNITFKTGFTTATPSCNITNQNGVTGFQYGVSAGGLSFAYPATSGMVIHWQCHDTLN